MSEIYFDREQFNRNITAQMIRKYIEDAVWQTMQDMNYEQVSNLAYEKFFKTVERIVRSEKIDSNQKVEKLLRLIKRYEIDLY